MKESKSNSVVGLVQARMCSTRLPNKMLLHLHGYPIIEWVYKRVLKSLRLDNVIFVIPDSPQDDVLDYYLKSISARVFRGSETNVLERFFLAAISVEASHIVRICADNPLIDPVEIDNLIEFYFNNPCDYAYNHIPKENAYPDGIGAEIVSFEILKNIYENAKVNSQKEHLFNFIWDNPSKFSIKTFDPLDIKIRRPEVRLDMDTYKDYLKLSKMNLNINMTSLDILKNYK